MIVPQLQGKPMAAGRHRTVTSTDAPLIPGQKMPAPSGLSAPQQAQWEAIVARLPTGWITNENAPLLKELCRHVSFAEELAHDIGAARAAGVASKELRALLRAHGYQTTRVASLSGKLRLTQLSRYTRDAEGAAIAARSAPTARKPWTDWGDGRH
jgi:hypothetical protein